MENTVVNVLRITRDDTIQVREWCPACGQVNNCYIVLAEVFCDNSQGHIRDWVEVHAGSIELKIYDYLRDEYGRLLADLFDRETGETLTKYLIDCGVAKPRPHHIGQVFESIVRNMEPGDAVG